MSELGDEARAALDNGLVLDGPSAEHRMRMKQRVLLALGAGTLTLGGASAVAAEGTAPLLAGGATALAKGVGVSSLLAWFGMGALAGVGVSGGVALGSTLFTPAPQASAPALQAAAPTPAHPMTESTLQLPAPAPHTPLSAPQPPRAGDVGESTPRKPAAESRSNASGQARRAETALESESLTPKQWTLSEEASLLQGAQRALAEKEPALALEILAEHERRFVSGALTEERKAARVLALCALGRTGEARELARAFVNASPRSLLLLRLERSCVASSVPNPREGTQ
jgi:hypothetical protein